MCIWLYVGMPECVCQTAYGHVELENCFNLPRAPSAVYQQRHLYWGVWACSEMTGRSQRGWVSAFQTSIGAVSVAQYGEGLSEISLVNSSF